MNNTNTKIIRYATLIIVSIILAAIDQLTKYLVIQNIELKQEIPVIGDAVVLTYIRNTGTAWSLLSGKTWFLIIVTFIVCAGIIYIYHNVILKTTKDSEMAVTSSDGRVQFVGTYAPKLLLGNNDGNLYMGADDDIRVPSENMNLDAFLGYFLLDLGNGLGMPGPAKVKKAIINVDGEVITKIFSIHHEQQVKEGWYSLDGRKLNGRPTAKGIYINNERKIVIK